MKVHTPIEIYVDNVGAIQMVRNNKGGAGTRHVNVRFHFVRELHENGIIIMKFVRSENNEADIMTKNPTKEEFNKHSPKLVQKLPEEFLASNKN